MALGITFLAVGLVAVMKGGNTNSATHPELRDRMGTIGIFLSSMGMVLIVARIIIWIF